MSQLSPQGQQVLDLVHRGGPFAYDRDGAVFGNRERLLPIRHRGYYREYTVAPAHAQSRGGHRIVCGGSRPTQPDTCYYTQDHYSSFKRITEP
ncbi:MAG: ribonuclease domain-containing protein [Ottowia sp.]|nr:ribonuclease [Ottowia sp.]